MAGKDEELSRRLLNLRDTGEEEISAERTLEELERDKPVYVVCQSGLRSYLACRILAQHGVDCCHLAGGYRLYEVIAKERCAAECAFPCGMEGNH